MIWLNASPETSESLSRLKDKLENSLADHNAIFKREHRLMSVHITRAKFNSSDNLPGIALPFLLNFQAGSLDLMESHLSKSGADYGSLSKISFKRADTY